MSYDLQNTVAETETLPAEFQQVEELAMEIRKTWLQSLELKLKNFLGV